MNTIIDLPAAPAATLADVLAPGGAARTVPCEPAGVVEEGVARFCPDCGGPVRVVPRRAVVPCAGCGAVHGASRFAPSVTGSRTERVVPAASRSSLAWRVARELVAVVASWWDPNGYTWMKTYLTVQGHALATAWRRGFDRDASAASNGMVSA